MSAEPTSGVVPGRPPRPTDEVRLALETGELELVREVKIGRKKVVQRLGAGSKSAS